MGDIKTTEFDLETSISDNDELLANISGGTARIPFKNIKSILSAWSNITGKPFDTLDNAYLIVTQKGDNAVLTLSDDIVETLNSAGAFASDIQALQDISHTHDNRATIDKFGTDSDGKLTWDSIIVGSDYTLPMATDSTLGGVKVDGTTITIDSDGIIHGSSSYELPTASNTTLGGVKVDGTSITISSDGVISSAAQGLDFAALTSAMTTGTLSGINITADSENERFNFEVTGIPTITIDDEGYWTINGDRGVNPTKAQGEQGKNGADGISPTVNIVATESGATISITDKDGTTTVDIVNGADGVDGIDGISPHIDETTQHWFIGDVDTGVNATAGIDDESISDNVTWSANKINSLIGDINTILESIVGGVT